MRNTPRLLLAATLALLLAAPVTANSSSAQLVTLTGTLSAVHEDALGSGQESDHYSLASGGEQYELRFADGGPDGQNGAEVTVTGRLVGHTLDVGASHGNSFRVRRQAPVSMVTSGGTTTTGSGPAAQAMLTGGAIATARIAAVLINFTDLPTTPFTTDQAAAALYGSSTSAKAFFEEESKGRMAVSGAVFGWYTIPATTTGCNWSTWVTLGANAANAAGANLDTYTNVVYIFPNTAQCGFAGLGYVPGSVSLLNGTLSVQVLTHELGHNFGLGHTNAIDCSANGTRVALSTAANCTERPYADPFSTMGNNALRHNQGSQLGELGWLADSEKVVGAPGQTYTITPYFASGGVHLVRIPRGDGSFFDLDFRMAYGAFDTFAPGSPAVSGVTIRLGWGTATPTSSPHATELIDTTPATASYADAPLAAGNTFSDPVSGISFTTESVSTLAAQIRVSTDPAPPPTSAPPTPAPTPTPTPPTPPNPPDTQAPTAPSSLTGAAATTSISLAWGASTDDRGVAGYLVARNGVVVANVGGTGWTDAGLAPQTTYTYTVTAVDGAGNQSAAAAIQVATAPDTSAPSTPQGFHRVRQSGRYVTFAWGAATDNVRVARYLIFRYGRSTPVASTPYLALRIYTTRGATYYVRAVDTWGNRSGGSAAVRIRR